MMYEVLKEATGLQVGETYTLEEMSKKGDVNNMVRKGIIRTVGFLSAGAPMSDSDAAKTINELQTKLEKAEEDLEESRADLRKANQEIRALKAGHVEGAKQLQEQTAKVSTLTKELEELKARK
jgi:chromosome segregation ATPase